MVNSIFTLRTLAAEWSDVLAGRVITDAWSQHRGEVMVAVEGRGQLHLRLHGPVQCTFRSPQASRARRNVAAVLAQAHGKSIKSVRVAPGDRILIMALEEGQELQAFLFGSQANVFLTRDNGKVIDAFRRGAYWAGRSLPAPLAAALPDTPSAFLERWQPANLSAVRALSRAFKVFDRTLVLEVMRRAGVTDKPAAACEARELEALFDSMQNVGRALERPRPRVYVEANTFSLIPLKTHADTEARPYPSVDSALRAWAKRALAQHALASLRGPLQKIVARALAKARRKAGSLAAEVQCISRAATYERYGHLLMARPPQPAGARAIVLDDIISGQDAVTIPLQPSLSTIENAERYYEKARKARQARHALAQQAKAAQERAERLLALLEEVSAAQSVADVKAIKVREASNLAALGSQQQVATRLPYRSYPLVLGYEVRVGKNARDSDALTLRYARSFDLWMHARGTSGAHVVLRLPNRLAQPGAELLNTAASLAAYHSKARGSALVPVIVTPRKFVRKPKGAEPGAVIVDQEEVLIVKPALPSAHA